MPAIPFIGPSYTLRSLNADAQQTINLYPELVESGTGKNAIVLHGTPGLRRWATCQGSGGIRGLWSASNGQFFAVRGSTLYRVTAGAAVPIGQLATQTGVVSMADNSLELCIVDGPNGYIYTFATGQLQAIADADFRGAIRVVYLDGYFVFNDPDSQIWYISALLAGGTIDGLDFASAETFPDQLITHLAYRRELWLFGAKSTEVWFNAGLPDFPFQRIQGAILEFGCVAPHSAVSSDDGIYWLGQSERGHGVVYRAEGYNPQRISTHAVEEAIQRLSTISDAVAFTYQHAGHAFYVLTFPTGEQTWVYDAATRLWHERRYRDPLTGHLGRHRAQAYAFFAGTHLVGDYETGAIYALDADTYTDDGAEIVRIRTAPHLFGGEEEFVAYHEFQLILETGVGLDGGATPGTDPQVMLQWSNDGGHTWSAEHWVSAGRLGAYRHEAMWRRLGRARDRVFRVTLTDPVKVALLNARILATRERV